jgi:hypothetical protein
VTSIHPLKIKWASVLLWGFWGPPKLQLMSTAHQQFIYLCYIIVWAAVHRIPRQKSDLITNNINFLVISYSVHFST